MIKDFGYLIILVIIFSCNTKEDSYSEPELALNLNVVENSTNLSNPVTVSIHVSNADSLYAISFEFHYSTDIFQTDPISIQTGNLFVESNQYEYLSDGEVSIVIAEKEKNNIKSTISGTVCTITLIPKMSGTSIFYLSSLHMIKTDGSSIEGFNFLSVSSLGVNIAE